MRKALITGITGQDGSYLAELLLKKNYEVHGIVRRVALEDSIYRLGRIKHIKDELNLHPGSIESYSRMIDIFDKVKPDECYHLAAQSFVHESFDDNPSTIMTNIQGTLNVLNALYNRSPDCKFYFAGSSEMFGKVVETPQNEETTFHPRSPYGITKVTGFDLTRNFRESYDLFSCSGILFNHESPRRGYEFVTRKITSNLARIKNGLENTIVLGNLNAKRDWGFAGDYVEAMQLILRQENPDDFVISTGESHTIKEFLDLAFSYADEKYEILDLTDNNIDEANKKLSEIKKYQDKKFVVQHPDFFRPAEVNILQGDSSKAEKKLGWKRNTTFNELVAMMVKNDLNNIS